MNLNLIPLLAAVVIGGASCAAPEPKRDAGQTYLALGDSYTIGESVPEQGRWPVQLSGEMGWAPPQIVARTGWTGRELLSAMEGSTFRPDGYDHVTLLIGVNNQYRGYPIEEFRGEFVELLGRAVRLARGKPQRVWVVSIPDWGETPFGQDSGRKVAAEIDAFNGVCKAEAAKAGIGFVDITPISRTVKAHPDLNASDGLHPSAKQYALWVAEVARALRSTTPDSK